MSIALAITVLDAQQLATLLAAMTHWHRTGNSEAYPDYFMKHQPLNRQELNALAEKINLPDPDETSLAQSLTETVMAVVRQELGYAHLSEGHKAAFSISRAARLMTGETIASFDDRVYGILHSQLQDAVTTLLVVEDKPDYSHRYSVLKCPSCGVDLTHVGSIKMVCVAGGCNSYTFTRLDTTGLLLDVSNLIANGYHAATHCSTCQEDLSEHEI